MNIAESKDIQHDSTFIAQIKEIIFAARQKAYKAVNSAMVEAYWLMGKRIVEEEQQGHERAAYGEEILRKLSIELTKEFGKGFSTRNLWDFRKFFLLFPDTEIVHTLCAQLSWSHIRLIMRVENRNAQKYYLHEAAENHWSVRTLDRNISTLYYQRLLSSHIKESVVQEMKEKTHGFQQITHQDIGQLDMYVRMYDDLQKTDTDNPTIGILLCTETDNTIAKYSVLKENRQLFASKYMAYLPSEEELKAEIERQKAIFAITKKNNPPK